MVGVLAALNIKAQDHLTEGAHGSQGPQILLQLVGLVREPLDRRFASADIVHLESC